MRVTRPRECPACGHERVQRRSQQLHTRSHLLRVTLDEWTCQLCAFTWTQPTAPKSMPDWEVA